MPPVGHVGIQECSASVLTAVSGGCVLHAVGGSRVILSLRLLLAAEGGQLGGRQQGSACIGSRALQVPRTENKATACIGDVDGYITVIGHGGGQDPQNRGIYATVRGICAEKVTKLSGAALPVHLGKMEGAGICHTRNAVHFGLQRILTDHAVHNKQKKQKTDGKQRHERDNILGKYALKHRKYSPSERRDSPRGSSFGMCREGSAEQLELVADTPDCFERPFVGYALQFLAQTLDVNVHGTGIA